MTDPRRCARPARGAEMPTVAVTGAAGMIGSVVRQRLADRYSLRLLTHKPADFPSRIVDLSNLDELGRAFDACAAVVHLAAAATVEADWDHVLTSNLAGARNVFEAAVRSGVPRVVFASSSHVVGQYEVQMAPGAYHRPADDLVPEDAPFWPDSLYGVSKAFGEVLGRYYADRYGLSVICLRIGSVRADDDPQSPTVMSSAGWLNLPAEERYARLSATWLSQRDCAALIAAAIDTSTHWAVAYGVSDNPHRFWSLRTARSALGFEPRDQAPDRANPAPRSPSSE